MLEKNELIEEFENFLNENGLFQNFKSWAEEKGYKITEFGMEDD